MLVKQPNGKFCYCNWYSGNNELNLTEQDVIDMYIEMAKQEMRTAKHYMELVERNAITDEELKEIGENRTRKEIMKYIPCMPDNQQYVHHDFTTYAKCPNCGNQVQNGIGYKDETCNSCGQLLKWK